MRLTDEQIKREKEIMKGITSTLEDNLFDTIEAQKQEIERLDYQLRQEETEHRNTLNKLARCEETMAKAREALNSIVWECTNKYIDVDENTFYRVSEALTAIDELGGGEK